MGRIDLHYTLFESIKSLTNALFKLLKANAVTYTILLHRSTLNFNVENENSSSDVENKCSKIKNCMKLYYIIKMQQ